MFGPHCVNLSRSMLWLWLWSIFWVSSAAAVTVSTEEGKCEAGGSHTAIWPTVDVIIPTFNRYMALKRAVKSVERQDYPKSLLHTYVIDDASTDPRYQDSGAKNTTTATWLRQRRSTRKHLGHPSAAYVRNIGINASSADIICLLDDDDEFLPGKLKAQVAAMSNDRCSFSSSDGESFFHLPYT